MIGRPGSAACNDPATYLIVFVVSSRTACASGTVPSATAARSSKRCARRSPGTRTKSDEPAARESAFIAEKRSGRFVSSPKRENVCTLSDAEVTCFSDGIEAASACTSAGVAKGSKWRSETTAKLRGGSAEPTGWALAALVLDKTKIATNV